MADEDRIVFPDEVENMKTTVTGAGCAKETTPSDEDRIIFPDEVEKAKARAKAVHGGGVEKTNAEFDNGRIVFPDEFEEMRAMAATGDNSVEAPEIDPRNTLSNSV